MWFALARWLCEQHDAVLQTPLWIGETVFDIDDPAIDGAPNVLLSWPLAPDMVRWEGIATLNTAEYAFPPMYSDADFRRYLPWRYAYNPIGVKAPNLLGHLRKGDFHQAPNLWPIVSLETMLEGVIANGFNREELFIVTEESPHVNPRHPAKLNFLQDFLMLCATENLVVYPASSFSHCAARFNQNAVYLPTDFKNGPTTCKWKLRT